jgi:hypothetical protein
MGAQYQNIMADEWTTAGAAEETVDVSLNGAAPASQVAVPDGQDLFIQDVLVNSIDDNASPLLMKVQQSDDNGGNWYTVEVLALPASGNVGDSLKANIRARGTEAGTLIRVRARTAAAGTLSSRLSAYLQDSVGD